MDFFSRSFEEANKMFSKMIIFHLFFNTCEMSESPTVNTHTHTYTHTHIHTHTHTYAHTHLFEV